MDLYDRAVRGHEASEQPRHKRQAAAVHRVVARRDQATVRPYPLDAQALLLRETVRVNNIDRATVVAHAGDAAAPRALLLGLSVPRAELQFYVERRDPAVLDDGAAW